jgi:hypothetical protein
MAAKGKTILYLLVVAPENRVSRYYIVLETSPWSSELTHLIQGLLGTSRTFIVTPRMPHKFLKSWLGRIHLIWQEFESITSSTFGFPKLLLYPLEIGVSRSHTTSIWTNFTSISMRIKFPTTLMVNNFLFDVVFRSHTWHL